MISIAPEVIESHISRVRSSAAELELAAEFFARQTILPPVADEPPTSREFELPIPAGDATRTVQAEFKNLLEMIGHGETCFVELVQGLATVRDTVTKLEALCVAAARQLDGLK